MLLRVAAVAAVTVGVAIGLAGPANADLTDGIYAADVTSEGMEMFPTNDWVFTSCGPGCLRREINPPSPETVLEFRLQGGTWVASGASMPTTVDNSSLVAQSGPITFQLVKVG